MEISIRSKSDNRLRYDISVNDKYIIYKIVMCGNFFYNDDEKLNDYWLKFFLSIPIKSKIDFKVLSEFVKNNDDLYYELNEQK